MALTVVDGGLKVVVGVLRRVVAIVWYSGNGGRR